MGTGAILPRRPTSRYSANDAPEPAQLLGRRAVARVHRKLIRSGSKGRALPKAFVTIPDGYGLAASAADFRENVVAVGDVDQVTERVVAVCAQSQLPSSIRKSSARSSLRDRQTPTGRRAKSKRYFFFFSQSE
jgi:hypothetical protein